ncbi:MAG TPA: hypothetical protein VE091_15755 [Gemmatimonadales bacterium]|nr:hypothetical protein [Gemmatimonadales bacterium]
MSDQPRDWDKELAAIDRAMERQPQLPAGAARPEVPSRSAAPVAAPPAGAPLARGAKATAWLRVFLVLLLAGAMPFWPYGRGCGFGLFAYMAAAGVVVLGGAWAAVSTWHRRRPMAHVLALLVTLWGIGLLAAEVLPRVGYARQTVRWACG